MLAQATTEGVDVETDLLVTLLWASAAFLVVAVVGLFVVDRVVARAIRARNPDNPTLVGALTSYLRVLVVVLALGVALDVAGYGRLLTGSAILVAALTVVLGVAGQEVVGDLVAGVFLVADPQFNVGDWIRWADSEGTVEAVGLRVTRVRTPANEIVTVPNTTLAATAVTRPFGHDQVRHVVRLGVGFDADLDAASAVLRSVAAETDGVLADPDPTVQVEDLADDAVRLRVQFWVDEPSRRDVLAVRSTFLRVAKARLEDAGITIDPPAGRDVSGTLGIETDFPPNDRKG